MIPPEGSRSSRSPPGEELGDPDDVTNYNLKDGDLHKALVIRWDGNGYHRDHCWFFAEADHVVDLDNNL